MFYITNRTGIHHPYRVEEINKDKKDQQPQHQFEGESEEEHREKFLKASKKLYEQRYVMVARQIMNENILLLNEDLSLDEAWELIRKHKIEYFPIISANGKLVGLLSERKILREIKESQGKKSLKDIMAGHTLCADSETDLQEVMQVFFKENIEAVPVINADQTVIGILSRTDLLKTMLKVSQIKP